MNTSPVGVDVLVVGAGLCGLTTALALARDGRRVRVLEQSRALGEVGAGITLSSGAMRCLELLGLEAAVLAHSGESVGLPFLHFRSGEVLRHGLAPGGRPAAARAARQIHRADLHALLADALRAQAPDALRLGARVAACVDAGGEVAVELESGEALRAEVLIGCDGVRSIVRESLFGTGSPRFAGQVAYRCLIPGEIAARHLRSATGAVYLGPGATFNRYPLRGGTLLNCVGLARTDHWQGEGWNTPATNAEMLERFADWHPEVRGLLADAPPAGIIKWALFDREPLPRWGTGRITLAGDAAHPMLPFLGLGAAMAIEDGIVLARALAANTDPQRALLRYEQARRPRTTRVHEASREQGRLSQQRDPERYAEAPAPAHDAGFFDYDPLGVAV